MTIKKEFEFEQYPFVMVKEERKWELTLKQSEVTVHDEQELVILSVSHPNLLESQIKWEEDSISFQYRVEKDDVDYASLKKQDRLQRIRSLINLGQVKSLLAMPVVFFIHPENIIFDHNLMPKVAYRGLVEKMPPKTMNEESLLRQYKSFVIALVEKKKTFTELYDGNLDSYRGSKFSKTVISAASFDELIDYLKEVYQHDLTEEQRRTRKVSKRQFRVFQQLSIWLGLLSVVLAVPVAYFLFFREPFQAKVLSADTAFFKNDYEAVIQTLDPIEVKAVPYAQKYTLAYSFVQGKDFTDKQKTVILNNISLKSDEQYLDYWIENGRGNLDEALDIAKKLEDSDLILFGLMQKIEQVRNDSTVTGADREEQIDKFESEYEKYDKKREESLNTELSEEAKTDSTGGQ